MQRMTSQVLIAGCGPVGLTLANCLVKSPSINSILLLDRKLPNQTRNLPELPSQRVYSLNGPTLNLFNNLGVSPLIRQSGSMNHIQVVSKQSQSCFNLNNNKAIIAENDEIVNALMQRLKSDEYKEKVNFIEDEIDSLENLQGCSSIKLKVSGAMIESELLVGSDGNKSRVKQLAKINSYGWNYRQKAVVCTMKISQEIGNECGYQIYHDGNVLAILPLWGNYVSLVWSLGLPDFEHLMQIPVQDFQQKLNNVINNSNYHLKGKPAYITIPNITQIMNKRLAFPLSTLQSGNYTQERIALIGDAAHTIHPMAGLGVNSGIMDSILLANNIIKNIKTGNDIGNLLALSEYEAQAKVFNYSNSLALQTIKQSFETNNWVGNKIRGIGLDLLDKSAGLKQILQESVNDQSIKYQWEMSS